MTQTPPKPVKTALFSYQLLSNIGCEVIIRGTIAFLKQAYPQFDMRFLVSSHHPQRDRALLADLPEVRIVPMLSWKRYWRGLLTKFGLLFRFWSPRFATGEFRHADLFVSVGGDIYTMPDGNLPVDWIGHELFATRHGIPSIMFGANMERFELLNEADRHTLLAHLARFRMICVRDGGSKEYLSANGIKDTVAVYPDPIFSLRQRTEFARKPVKAIGLNVTPLMKEEFGPDIIGHFARLATQLVERGYGIRLIPHVYSSEEIESIDDRGALRELHAALPEAVRDSVELYHGPLSFNDVAAALAQIDLFIGGRMHACLNSLTLGKAVCFLGYSKKVHTMVGWLKSESPFAPMAGSFTAIAADKVSLDHILSLIDAHDGWAARGTEPVRVDLGDYLRSLPVWDRLPALEKT